MIALPIGLDRTLQDTFGDTLWDAPKRELTVRVALIRVLEVTRLGQDTEATALRLKLLSLVDDGTEVETGEARLIVNAVEENIKQYSRMVVDALTDYLEPVKEALKRPAEEGD